jgi:hypothetical protein
MSGETWLLFFAFSDGARFDDVRKLLSFEKLDLAFGAVFGLFWENRSFFLRRAGREKSVL